MFKRRLKAERDGDILFVPKVLTLNERVESLKTVVRILLQTKIDVRKEDGKWIIESWSLYSRIMTASAAFDTFLRGYVYQMYDLSKDEDYQVIKFLEWLETLDPDIRAAVMAEYEDR